MAIAHISISSFVFCFFCVVFFVCVVVASSFS